MNAAAVDLWLSSDPTGLMPITLFQVCMVNTWRLYTEISSIQEKSVPGALYI